MRLANQQNWIGSNQFAKSQGNRIWGPYVRWMARDSLWVTSLPKEGSPCYGQLTALIYVQYPMRTLQSLLKRVQTAYQTIRSDNEVPALAFTE